MSLECEGQGATCDECGEYDFLPTRCPRCGGVFCHAHMSCHHRISDTDVNEPAAVAASHATNATNGASLPRPQRPGLGQTRIRCTASAAGNLTVGGDASMIDSDERDALGHVGEASTVRAAPHTDTSSPSPSCARCSSRLCVLCPCALCGKFYCAAHRFHGHEDLHNTRPGRDTRTTTRPTVHMKGAVLTVHDAHSPPHRYQLQKRDEETDEAAAEQDDHFSSTRAENHAETAASALHAVCASFCTAHPLRLTPPDARRGGACVSLTLILCGTDGKDNDLTDGVPCNENNSNNGVHNNNNNNNTTSDNNNNHSSTAANLDVMLLSLEVAATMSLGQMIERLMHQLRQAIRIHTDPDALVSPRTTSRHAPHGCIEALVRGSETALNRDLIAPSRLYRLDLAPEETASGTERGERAEVPLILVPLALGRCVGEVAESSRSSGGGTACVLSLPAAWSCACQPRACVLLAHQKNAYSHAGHVFAYKEDHPAVRHASATGESIKSTCLEWVGLDEACASATAPNVVDVRARARVPPRPDDSEVTDGRLADTSTPLLTSRIQRVLFGPSSAPYAKDPRVRAVRTRLWMRWSARRRRAMPESQRTVPAECTTAQEVDVRPCSSGTTATPAQVSCVNNAMHIDNTNNSDSSNKSNNSNSITTNDNDINNHNINNISKDDDALQQVNIEDQHTTHEKRQHHNDSVNDEERHDHPCGAASSVTCAHLPEPPRWPFRAPPPLNTMPFANSKMQAYGIAQQRAGGGGGALSSGEGVIVCVFVEDVSLTVGREGVSLRPFCIALRRSWSCGKVTERVKEELCAHAAPWLKPTTPSLAALSLFLLSTTDLQPMQRLSAMAEVRTALVNGAVLLLGQSCSADDAQEASAERCAGAAGGVGNPLVQAEVDRLKRLDGKLQQALKMDMMRKCSVM